MNAVKVILVRPEVKSIGQGWEWYKRVVYPDGSKDEADHNCVKSAFYAGCNEMFLLMNQTSENYKSLPEGKAALDLILDEIAQFAASQKMDNMQRN